MSINLESFHHKKKNWNCVRWMLTKFILLAILQYIQVLNNLLYIWNQYVLCPLYLNKKEGIFKMIEYPQWMFLFGEELSSKC